MPLTAVRRDPALPWLEAALEASSAGPRVVPAVAAREEVPTGARLVSASLRRHKPGRRALIRYHLAASASGWHRTALGKTRSRGLDRKTADLLDRLAPTCLGATGRGTGAVPRVLGLVPEFELWLQEEVPGRPGFVALASRDGPDVAHRIGIALAELHQAGPAADRRHTIADELAALDQRFRALGASAPSLGGRLVRLFDRLTRLAEQAPPADPVGLHRDFYPDQVLLAERVYLLDLDLYAEGDPALDLGNFIGHLIEFDIRTGRRTAPLAALAPRLLEGYHSVRPTPPPQSIAVYQTLTLARHLTLSTTFAGREHTLEPLLLECERRTEDR